MKYVKQGFEIIDPIDGEVILKKLEYCGRVCYKSEGTITEGSAKRFVKMLVEHGHESVLEHVSITVKVITDRGISHEIVRHRVASYSQESTRYCNYSSGRFNNELTFVVPEELKNSDSVTTLLEEIEMLYDAIVNLWGLKPEVARDILPTCLKTELVITYNLREWRHFFKMRTDSHAHPKVRELANAILVAFKQRIPVVFDDIKSYE